MVPYKRIRLEVLHRHDIEVQVQILSETWRASLTSEVWHSLLNLWLPDVLAMKELDCCFEGAYQFSASDGNLEIGNHEYSKCSLLQQSPELSA